VQPIVPILLDQFAWMGAADATAITIHVTTAQPWAVMIASPWVTVTPPGGAPGTTEVTIEISENYGPQRTGMITLQGATGSLAIFSLAQASGIVTVPSAVATAVLPTTSVALVHSNQDWVAAAPYWITLSQNAGPAGNTAITVTTSQNLSWLPRIGVVGFRGTTGYASAVFGVTQSGLLF
jgi:hypothetical protein